MLFFSVHYDPDLVIQISEMDDPDKFVIFFYFLLIKLRYGVKMKLQIIQSNLISFWNYFNVKYNSIIMKR